MAPLYVLAAALAGYELGKRRFAPIDRWLAEDRPPSAEERAKVLSLPWHTAGMSAAGWGVAAVIFGAVTATHHPVAYIAGTVLGILLAGLSTVAVSFLLVERAMRPLFARVLAGEEPGTGLGTGPRLLVSWALGSGVALVAIAVAFLGRGDERAADVLPSILFLVVAGLFAGGVLVSSAARSVADPVRRVRAALERVEQGSLEEQLVVDDGGEIGVLQSGFNRMVEGLRERERIRDAFGTYVDREVAEHILREGTALEGEEVEVTAMFIDVRGFTTFAERLSAAEVVSVLNRLFARIVPIVHAHGGHVDKYVGDGLLAVFGAPRRREDHADQALRASREIADAVAEEFCDDLTIGIGLNSGRVVAGNVGGAGRLEFSVIGDAVNVAARVEAATRQTGDCVLVSEHTRALLSDDVAASLEPRPTVPLKGKSQPVALLAVPAHRHRRRHRDHTVTPHDPGDHFVEHRLLKAAPGGITKVGCGSPTRPSMPAADPRDISNPFFVRFYRRNRQSAVNRGENDHRRRVLQGLSGRVVELGAGDGANFPLYPPTVSEVIAVEPEPRFRAQATEVARAVSLPIRVEPGTAEDLPVEDGSIDAVVASLVLCTVPDQPAALAEARRALRSGGELRFYEHVHATRQPLKTVLELADRSRIWPTLGGGCHPTRDTLGAIEEAGFTVERCESFPFSPSPMVPTIPHILGVARKP